MFSKVPALRGRLGSSPKLSVIEYTDRYLRTPLTARLLLESLRYLKSEFPNAIADDTEVIVTTTPVESGDRRGYPTAFSHDWRRGGDRQAVIESAAATLGFSITFKEVERRRLAHHRGLTLNWGTDLSWKMRLDEGFGFLAETSRSDSFPFESNPASQAAKLFKGRLHVDRRVALPTQFYVQHIAN